MANTGYIINPKVVQMFTTGPNSGTQVNSTFTASFDVSSSFTSSFLCETQYFYKELDYINCPVSGFCPIPDIKHVLNNDCNSYDYIYNIEYRINSTIVNTPSSSLEYCLNNSFTGETGSISYNNTSNINFQTVNISSLIDLPLNQFTPVYFRLKNNCSGSINSTYSNIVSSSCLDVPSSPPTLYRVLLAKNSEQINACDSGVTGLCTEAGFCGDFYWIDTEDYVDSTLIYTQESTSFPGTIGWYTDGDISKYWNGSSFTNLISCS